MDRTYCRDQISGPAPGARGQIRPRHCCNGDSSGARDADVPVRPDGRSACVQVSLLPPASSSLIGLYPDIRNFDLEYVLCRARIQRAGCRVAALREGTVTLYRHNRVDRADEIWTSSALRWIEAEVFLDSHRFFLMDEHWYEIDQEYLKAIRSHAEQLITDTPPVDLPPWVLGEKERTYNASVPDQRPGYVCFDRDNVQTALHRGNGVEICDLLSPDNVLVMVKRAKGSDALSHLFGQALVAVQTLRNSPEGRERFAEKVAAARQGRGLPKDFRPSKVVFAILLKDGADLTADTLFPFSQVTLVQTVRTLETWGVQVEVVGIKSTPSTITSTGTRRLAA
ncbi:TIGR04141 family sporadically distributed protein [Streptomyces sp. NPDC005373]|uniref:TIGR04141 family sporadically distributed protein n=1 Tax=Streptomyces sp. NPDC005373 TaxID=3156879 RepID=UPI00339F460B